MRTRTGLALGAGLIALVGCTAQVSPPPTAGPSPAGVTLSGQGVAGHAFGSEAAVVEPALSGALGAPARVAENTGCPLAPRWTRTLGWQGLTVTFEADTATKTDQTQLTTWQVTPAEGIPAGITLADGLPTTPTFDDLTAQYPGTKVTQQLGWYLLELPSNVTYFGEDKRAPTIIHGGPVQFCE